MKVKPTERSHRMRRLILSAADVNAVRGREMESFIRPVATTGAWKVASTIPEAWAIYEKRTGGSPWGKPYLSQPDRVYSSEKLIKTDHGTAAYEDGQDTNMAWRENWQGKTHRAIYQPFNMARFTTAIKEIEIIHLDSIHYVEIMQTGMNSEQFAKWWNELYGAKFPMDTNPICWMVTIGETEWLR